MLSWQKLVRQVNVRALRKGMNTCVRPSRSVDASGSASDALKRALKMILNGVAMRLALPAGERRAVVRDNEFQPLRHANANGLRSCGHAFNAGCDVHAD